MTEKKTLSKEHRANISASLTGKTRPPEVRAKISTSMAEYQKNPEAGPKTSQATLLRQNRRRKESEEAWRVRMQKRREDRKEFVDTIKLGETCPWCHLKPAEVEKLIYHHTEPRNDDVRVSALVSRRSEERILQEIIKCILVCVSCHLRFHLRHEWTGVRFKLRARVYPKVASCLLKTDEAWRSEFAPSAERLPEIISNKS